MAGMWLGLAVMAALQQTPPAGSPPGPPPGGAPGGPPGAAGPQESFHPRGRLFISPMGEPFRTPDSIGTWFEGADKNHDGVVTLPEFLADADRFFLVLDREHDGEIDPEDIDYYETVLAPEIRSGGDGMGDGGGKRGGGKGGGRHGGGGHGGGGGGGMGGGGMGGGGMGGGGGGMGGGRGGGEDGGEGGESSSTPKVAYDDVARGAARFGFFAYPEPITSADANLNRGVDITEFRNAAETRFGMLDKKGDGRLTRDELPKLSGPPGGGGGKQGWYGGKRRTAGAAGTSPEQRGPQDSTAD